MDPVSAVQSNNSTASSDAATAISKATNGTVDYNAFLTLLVTELKNQDPTKPTDNAEFISQLASFSNVEQQIQVNEKLTTLIQATQLGEASNLINKTVTSADGSVSGLVTSVRLTSEGVVAKLADGGEVPIGQGTVIEDGVQ